MRVTLRTTIREYTILLKSIKAIPNIVMKTVQNSKSAQAKIDLLHLLHLLRQF